MIKPKFDIVTPKTAKNAYIIIGFQAGICGLILRIGLYKER